MATTADPQPVPLMSMSVSVAAGEKIITSMVRQWNLADEGTGRSCRLRPGCGATNGVCLVVVDESVADKDVPLHSYWNYLKRMNPEPVKATRPTLRLFASRARTSIRASTTRPRATRPPGRYWTKLHLPDRLLAHPRRLAIMAKLETQSVSVRLTFHEEGRIVALDKIAMPEVEWVHDPRSEQTGWHVLLVGDFVFATRIGLLNSDGNPGFSN